MRSGNTHYRGTWPFTALGIDFSLRSVSDWEQRSSVLPAARALCFMKSTAWPCTCNGTRVWRLIKRMASTCGKDAKQPLGHSGTFKHERWICWSYLQVISRRCTVQGLRRTGVRPGRCRRPTFGVSLQEVLALWFRCWTGSLRSRLDQESFRKNGLHTSSPSGDKFPYLKLDHESGRNILVFGRRPKTFDRKWSRMRFHSFLFFATSLDLPEPSYVLFRKIMYLLL